MLYNARVDVIKILFIIIKNEAGSIKVKKIREKVERGEQVTQEEKKLILDKMRAVSRLESQLSQFKHEHKIYRGHFIFKEVDYQITLQLYLDEIREFIEKYQISL